MGGHQDSSHIGTGMTTYDPQKMKFLIVDDMDTMRRSIRAMLKLIRFGVEHYEAANGKEAWKLLSEKELEVDFIISDWHMPKMSGTELLNTIRLSKKHRDIPFLMITAEANQSIVAEAAEQEVDAYLTKPFVTATLEQKIKELLHNAQHPSQLNLLLKAARDLREKGEIDKGIAAAMKAAEINNRSSRPFRELGLLFLKKDDLQKAVAAFRKATELNRLDVTSYHSLGQLYLKLNDIDKAIVNFARAVELSPRHSERALKFASILLERKLHKEAEKILRLVLKQSESDLDIQEEVADLCARHGLFDLACKTYQATLKQDPERIHLGKKLGLTLAQSGDPKDAIEILERLVVKLSEDVELLLALAKAYLDLKMPMRADKWAAKATRLAPDNPEAKRLLDQCMDL